MDKFKLVVIDAKYCDYLRKFDAKVAYNKNEKALRPFVGVLFTLKDIEYFAPLSSPKLKHQKMHNTIDFIKLDNGNLGALNINNMIPVTKLNYKFFELNKDLNGLKEKQYYILLNKQLIWLNARYRYIKNKSLSLYNKYLNNCLPLEIKKRCCNFRLLEEKCLEYKKNAKDELLK